MIGRVVTVAVVAVLVAPPAAVGDVVHDHASQRYDRPVDLVRDEFRRHTRRPVSVVTWTEVQGPARSAPLHRPDDGWASRTDPRTDVAVSWRTRRFDLRASSVRLLTGATYRTRAGFERRTRMIATVLDGRGGRRVLVTVAHLPAVDYDRPDRARRMSVWRAAVEGWADDVRDLRRRWQPDLVLTVADWNVNLRRPTWRRYLTARFTGQRVTWAHPLPRRGTHGESSLIDGTLSNARGRARLLPRTSASDHVAYRERLSISTP